MDVQLPSRGELVDVARLLGRPVPLVINAAGLGCIAATVGLGFGEPVGLVDGVLLSVGLSAPIAQHFELKQRATSDEITRVSDHIGLKNIFVGRLEDRARFRASVDQAFAKSRRMRRYSRIRLMGIAFYQTFNPHPDDQYGKKVCQILNDPRVPLEVSMMDPKCADATLRATIERGHLTIKDIVSTLDEGIPAVIRTRLRTVVRKNSVLRTKIAGEAQQFARDGNKFSAELVNQVVDLCNIHVRITDRHPFMFAILTKSSVFCEQYLLGCPETLRPGDCIGKRVPVYEYSGSSEFADYCNAHFETIWRMSSDWTQRLITGALESVFVNKEDPDLPIAA